MCHRKGAFSDAHLLQSTLLAHPSSLLRPAVSSTQGPSSVTFPIRVGASMCLGSRDRSLWFAMGLPGRSALPDPGPPFWHRKGLEGASRPYLRSTAPRHLWGEGTRLSRRKGAATGGGFVSDSGGRPRAALARCLSVGGERGLRGLSSWKRRLRYPRGEDSGVWGGRSAWRHRGSGVTLTCSRWGLATGLRAAARPGETPQGGRTAASPRPASPRDGELAPRGASADPRSPRLCVSRRPVAVGPCRWRVRVRTRGPRSPKAAAVSHRPGPERGAPRPPSRVCPAGEAPPPQRSQALGGREATDHHLPPRTSQAGAGVQANESLGEGLGRAVVGGGAGPRPPLLQRLEVDTSQSCCNADPLGEDAGATTPPSSLGFRGLESGFPRDSPPSFPPSQRYPE